MKRLMVALAFALAFALPLAAQQPSNPATKPAAQSYEVRAATSKIEINGVLDEQAWQDATVIPIDYEWLPGDNAKPPVRTDGLITFDGDNIYIAFRAYDPKPSEIRAHLMDRDSINTFVQDDHVTFMFDPFNDERRAFQFRVNPLGVQADAIFSQVEFVEDFSWDIIWASAGRITSEGYVVEVAVPVNQLRFPRTDAPQTWGVELGRSYPRSVRHRMSANPRNRNNNCLLCQINKVTGFRGLEPGKNLEVVPTLTTTRTDEAGSTFPQGGLEDGDTKIDPGVSARWGISPAITMNATINPDFSQIEADAAQLAENERFALFFAEKRPFFLEGVDFFATPINAVFTRTVVDPAWGLKFTGKEGKNAGGIFLTQDEVNSLVIPANQGSRSVFLEDRVTATVARYRRDIRANSTFGVLYAGRQGDDYHNHVAGLDGFLRLSDADEIRVQYLRSDTQYPGAVANEHGTDSFAGDAFRFNYDHVARNWIWSAAYDDFDPNFRADSGFVPRVDIRTMFGALTRRFWGDRAKDWYTLWQVGARGTRTKDHSGRLTDEEAVLTSTVQGPMQSLLQVNVRQRSTFFIDRLHEDMLTADAYFEIQPGAIGKFSLFVQGGEAVDFAHNQPADVLLLNPAAEVKIGRHINAQLGHILQRLDVDTGRLSDTNITELRLVYTISIRAFLRAIVQHVDIERDPAQFVTPEIQTLFTQLLFSYKVNPQTVLFLGYSDNQLGLRQGTQQFDLTRTDRTFFAKIGYAWIF